MAEQKEFANGIYFKAPREGAPDFVLGSVNIKRIDFMKFLAEKEGDYVNLNLLRSWAGKPYFEVDNWKPNTEAVPSVNAPTEQTGGSQGNSTVPNIFGGKAADDFEDDIPF
jgi:hypothetical protein